MASFKDSAGRQWTLGITVAGMARVKTALGVNLCDLHTQANPTAPTLMFSLGHDAALLFGVLFELVRPQAEKIGLTLQQFLEGFDAATVGPAAEAFWEELASFFQSLIPETSQLIREIGKLQKAMLAADSGAPSGDAPAPAESIPAQ